MTFPDLSKLFSTKKQTIPSTPTPPQSTDFRNEGESYLAYGKRACQFTNGNPLSLRTILQRIYNSEKSRQITDQETQELFKKAIRKKIGDIDVELTRLEGDKISFEEKVTAAENDVNDLKSQKIEAINKNGELNKMAQLKMWIGIVILAILTLYLFIFYSSTFYSAFFKDFNAEIKVGEAMFDPDALSHAWGASSTQFLFIVCAPIIFMGLGFALHFFSVQKGYFKYVKMGAILIVTFIFDCILAYAIAKHLYDIEIMTKLGDFPPYNLSMAVGDANVWAVIFCGFIVYVIWGIVFDMTLTAYEDLKSNRNEIETIQVAINGLKEKIAIFKDKINEISNTINARKVERSNLQAQLNQSTIFNPTLIDQAFSDFFAGWTAILGALQLNGDECAEVYNQEKTALLASA